MSRKAQRRAGLGPALLATAALAGAAATFLAWRAESLPAPAARGRERERVASAARNHERGRVDFIPRPPTDATLRDWATRSPRDAWPWLRDHSARLSPPDEPSLIAVFLRHLAARDPEAVLALANESLARTDGPAIASAAIDALLENNRPELARRQVEAWATDPHAPAPGAAPFQAVAWRLARDSDHAAADWLAGLPASADRDAAFAGTAANWAEHDPQAAMIWAGGLPAGDARAAAMERAFRIWADHDTVVAANWLLEHEARPEADRLIGAWLAASPAAAENPRLALQWVALIRDDSARRRSYDLVLTQWRERDAPAAARFVSNVP